MRKCLAATAAVALLSAAGAASAGNFVVIGKGKSLGDSFAADVEAAGGRVVAAYPFGVAVVSSDDPGFSLAGRTVVADVGFDSVLPEVQVSTDAGYPPNSGDDDFFFDLQWGHNYVGAQEAWNSGNTGAGARVAVLDGGFDLDHPDLAPNINLALSADFTGEGLQYGLPDTFSHGTHVAGTIAAADNGFGTIGVAPGAELVLVKVLGDAGSGSFADVIAGIYHAAMVDADVINMSLGTIIPRTSDPAGVSALDNAVSQAVAFAFQQGTTTIVSAGNAASDLDGDGDLVRFNSTARHSIEISALTTLNWASDPANATLVPASYTNYGTSGVTFSAPGGSVDYPGNEGCVVAGLARPCWVFDLVFSTGNGGWYWSAGTSMAAPHAAGVAALIIAENGGDMHPAQVERELRARGIDMGKRGRDDYYGHGLVNSGY
ncbi:MAG: S8 family serine peptidase [Woeseiaceae bacterium]